MQDDLTSEHYWAAGFLEGEGSFCVDRLRTRIIAAQKEREPLLRLKRLFGGTIHFSPSGPIHVWTLSIDAGETMKLLRPLMSQRRQGQIDYALEECARRREEAPGLGARNRRKTHCPNGHEYDLIRYYPDGRVRSRECKKCRNDRRRERYQNDLEYREQIKRAVYEARARRKIARG